VEYLGSNKSDLDLGFSHGYSQIYGDSRPEIRKDNVTLAWQLVGSGYRKSYPYSIYTIENQPNDFIQEISAFRCYFNPKAFSQNATDIYWYKENDNYILNCDYHHYTMNDTITLPFELNNKIIEIIDKTDSFTLLTNLVENNQIVLSVNNDYGFGLLKLIDFVPPRNVQITHNTEITSITWNEVGDATSYKIYSSEDPYGSFADVSDLGVFNGTSWELNSDSDRLFYYVVAVVDDKSREDKESK